MTDTPRALSTPAERRRVVVATVAGTAIEWYDFFIYATAAGLVFTQLFFEPAGNGLAPLLAFASVGISFLFRPLGAFLAGHFGDRYGRRLVLMVTLIMMGAATALIGILPTFEAIGIAAPVILVTLRILQGISAGGEWGGAALLAVEHAPDNRRGLHGSAPQLGVPLGLLLSSGIMAIMTQVAPGEAFLEWGWRVPFLLSIVLVVVGWFIRRAVEESPVFTEIAARKEKTRAPIVQLLRKHTILVLLAALIPAAGHAIGYMSTGGYIQRYATNPDGPIGLETGPVLGIITIAAASWLIFVPVGGWLSDKIGRKRALAVGWTLLFPAALSLFPLVNTGTLFGLWVGLTLATIGLGIINGPLSAHFAETFPASIRFSGVSIAYAIGAIVGGAFAPMIAEAIVGATGGTDMLTVYLAGMVVVSLTATLILRDRTRVPLGIDADREALREKVSA